MDIKGIFFDLYGTLIIYGDMDAAWESWFLSIYNGFRDHGLNHSAEEFADECDGFFSKKIILPDGSVFTPYEWRMKGIADSIGIDIPAENIKAIASSALESWHNYVILDPNSKPVLEYYKEKKLLGLITNFDHPPHVYSILKEFEIDHYFDFTIISGEVGIEKPDKMIFNMGLEKANLSPREVVYVGDSMEYDILGALNARIIPVHIERNNNTVQHDYTINGSNANPEIDDHCKVIYNLKELYDIIN